MSNSTFRVNRVGAVGAIAVAMTVGVSGFGIVRAERAHPQANKVFSCTTGTACLEGNASGSATDGVYGSSEGSGTHGVFGTSNWIGVLGYTSSTTGGSGVSGVSTSGSGSANGVYGKSESPNGPGVYGESSVSDGVYGITTATSSVGVYGDGKGPGTGVFAGTENATTYAALQALGVNANTNLFYAINVPTADYCSISSAAALYCSGGITGSVLRAPHRNGGGQRLLTYASESATATIEDFGSARMVGGVANVPIDPAFASVMDRRGYYVFLTPLGDTRGLYVGSQDLAGFQVRESERGRGTLAFDYRIVAHPLDAPNDRLPLAPRVKKPPKLKHPSR